VRTTITSRIGLAAIAGCVALGSLAVAGCGGGSSSTTDASGASGASGVAGSTPLSKDQFLSQANAICSDVNQKVEALKAPPENPQSAAEVVPFLVQGLSVARTGATQLEALNPPPEFQDERDQLVANTKKQLVLTGKAIAAAKANDTSQFQSIANQINAINKQDNEIASSMGLTECAKDAEPQG
jgi:hypothetical protein